MSATLALRLSAVALALAVAGCAGNAAPRPTRPAAPSAMPRGFLPADPLRLAEADSATLAARMAAGDVSSVRLTQAYLDRIAALDDDGPRLNAVIQLNPHARAEARALDA